MTLQKTIHIQNLALANDRPFTLFGGINVIESEALALEAAESFVATAKKLAIPLVFKASYDKANRSSVTSFRGPGLEQGLKILAKVKERFQIPILSDIHAPSEAEPAAQVCDVLQIPAFLARQTDLVVAAAKTGRVINIKKPQFLAPDDMPHIVQKCTEAGNSQIIVCERGTSFGYHNLVVDMLAFPIMKQMGYPVFFDVTHALQMPGGLGHAAAGRRQYVTELARAGMAQGIAGLFLEAHPEPSIAKCDGPCALKLELVEPFLRQMKALDELIKGFKPLDTR